MIKILFVCHGNICRSPMAEFVMKDLVHKEGLDDYFYIESCAVSREEIGNSVYPPVRKLLNGLGIDCSAKKARVMTSLDYGKFDYIIAMDESNLYGIKRIVGEDLEPKVHLLLEYTKENRDVRDPWYTRNFDETYRDVLNGCTALLNLLKKEI